MQSVVKAKLCLGGGGGRGEDRAKKKGVPRLKLFQNRKDSVDAGPILGGAQMMQ